MKSIKELFTINSSNHNKGFKIEELKRRLKEILNEPTERGTRNTVGLLRYELINRIESILSYFREFIDKNEDVFGRLSSMTDVIWDFDDRPDKEYSLAIDGLLRIVGRHNSDKTINFFCDKNVSFFIGLKDKNVILPRIKINGLRHIDGDKMEFLYSSNFSLLTISDIEHINISLSSYVEMFKKKLIGLTMDGYMLNVFMDKIESFTD